jgi:hypothetical protein
MSIQKGDTECTMNENPCSEPQQSGFSKACCWKTVCHIFTQLYSEQNIICEICIRREHGNVKGAWGSVVVKAWVSVVVKALRY